MEKILPILKVNGQKKGIANYITLQLFLEMLVDLRGDYLLLQLLKNVKIDEAH